MTKITLNILAKDILENPYVESDTCPITRALERAGYPDYCDAGTCIIKKDTFEDLITDKNKTYQSLVNKITEMYNTKYNDNPEIIYFDDSKVKIAIEDFEHTLIF